MLAHPNQLQALRGWMEDPWHGLTGIKPDNISDTEMEVGVYHDLAEMFYKKEYDKIKEVLKEYKLYESTIK